MGISSLVGLALRRKGNAEARLLKCDVRVSGGSFSRTQTYLLDPSLSVGNCACLPQVEEVR